MKHAVKRFLLFAAIIGFVFGAPWFSVSAAAAGEPAAALITKNTKGLVFIMFIDIHAHAFRVRSVGQPCFCTTEEMLKA